MPKVWTTGHVVVPKALREQFDLHPGDEVVFEKRDGGIAIRKAPPQPKRRERPEGHKSR